MTRNSSPVQRLAKFLFALLMAFIWSGGYLYAQQQASPHAQHLQDLAARLDKEIQSVADAEHQIPRDTFDFQTIIQKVGSDPTKLFEWVRDNTLWAPYTGALRGPMGVLMDRMGNSLDRSLLLAKLLTETGATARLAHGTLQQPGDVLTRLLKQDVPSRAQATVNDDEKLAQQHKQIEQRVAAQFSTITNAIGAAPVQDQGGDSAAAANALADHWWVQIQKESQWRDYDPLLSDNQPGRALTSATQTVDFKKDDAGKLPLEDSLCHRLVVRVIAEQWKGGSVHEATVLEKSLRPAEVFGKRIAFSHIPLDWPTSAGKMDSPQAIQQVKSAILAQHEWVPALSIGDDLTIQSSVSNHGQINPKPQMDPLARTGGGAASAAQKVVDIFGGGGDAPAPKEEGQFTAEWLEYVLRCPGQPDRTFRREVFDLIGPAARANGVPQEPAFSDKAKIDAGLLLLGETDMLPLPCQLSAEFAGHVTLSDIVASRKAFADLMHRMSSASTQKGDPYHPQPAQLYTMAALRGKWNPHADELFIDSPDLLTYHFGFALSPTDEAHVRQSFDIVANQLAVRPKSWPNARALRLEQGILDTNLETMFVSLAGRRDNAADVMSASPPDQWVILKGADDPQWNQLQLSDDVRARIRQELQSGLIVLAPRAALKTDGGESLAWWSIDPKTGSALGKGPHGFGAVSAEYGAMLQRIAVFVEENKTWICMGSICYQAAAAVAIVLGLPLAGTVLSDISNILSAVCGPP